MMIELLAQSDAEGEMSNNPGNADLEPKRRQRLNRDLK
jgi:hypothetical protein